tara:strand:+ start:751 stop:1110 length:360 start_codon:yes stop_codon:yes gene_type:complete
MRISNRHLRTIIREELKRTLREQANQKEDSDLNIEELEGMSLPPVLKKLLDPDVTPAKYAKIDQMLDASGNINHQAFAIAAFTLSYADMDEMVSKQMLQKAVSLVPKIIAAREKGQKGE